MSAAKAKKKTRQRMHRYTSNVFSMFNQEQIQEFKVIYVASKYSTLEPEDYPSNKTTPEL